jgi:hypothetical protein
MAPTEATNTGRIGYLMSATSRFFTLLIAGLPLLCDSTVASSQVVHELPWSQVNLVGMHLSLISPKRSGTSTDLRFSETALAIESCDHDYCTGPLTVWKIEGNRLKIGYGAYEGATLISLSSTRLVMRDKDGTVSTYAIVRP